MTPDEIVEQAELGRVTAISREDLAPLLERAASTQQDNTSIAGLIRTLHVGDLVLVQERTPEGDHFVRRVASEDAAGRFVEARLAAYERMWDG